MKFINPGVPDLQTQAQNLVHLHLLTGLTVTGQHAKVAQGNQSVASQLKKGMMQLNVRDACTGFILNVNRYLKQR